MSGLIRASVYQAALIFVVIFWVVFGSSLINVHLVALIRMYLIGLAFVVPRPIFDVVALDRVQVV
jgi:hypothetical protein